MRKQLKLKTKLLKAKIRNIIYYRLEVEPLRPERKGRAQYIHILRKLRNDINELLINPDIEKDVREYFSPFLSIIPEKIKSSQCLEVIINMKIYEEKREKNS